MGIWSPFDDEADEENWVRHRTTERVFDKIVDTLLRYEPGSSMYFLKNEYVLEEDLLKLRDEVLEMRGY